MVGARLALAGLVPLSVGIAVNWAKFRHPYMFPLEDQVWTSVNEHRRLALAANGGDLVSPKIFPSTAVNYFRPDGIRFIGAFPFVTLPADPAQSYGGSFLDQTYRTGSVVAFMPLLFLLSAWGLRHVVPTPWRARRSTHAHPAAGRARHPRRHHVLRLHRLPLHLRAGPLLVLGSAIGFTDLARRLQGRGGADDGERWWACSRWRCSGSARTWPCRSPPSA